MSEDKFFLERYFHNNIEYRYDDFIDIDFNGKRKEINSVVSHGLKMHTGYTEPQYTLSFTPEIPLEPLGRLRLIGMKDGRKTRYTFFSTENKKGVLDVNPVNNRKSYENLGIMVIEDET